MGDALKIARDHVAHHQRELLRWMQRQAWLEASEESPTVEVGEMLVGLRIVPVEDPGFGIEPEEKPAPLVTPEETAMLLRPEPEKKARKPRQAQAGEDKKPASDASQPGKRKNIPPEQFRAAFAEGLTVQQAADRLGVCYATAYHWQKKLAREGAIQEPARRTRKGGLTRWGHDQKIREEQMTREQQFLLETRVENGVTIKKYKPGHAHGSVPLRNLGEGVRG